MVCRSSSKPLGASLELLGGFLGASWEPLRRSLGSLVIVIVVVVIVVVVVVVVIVIISATSNAGGGIGSTARTSTGTSTDTRLRLILVLVLVPFPRATHVELVHLLFHHDIVEICCLKPLGISLPCGVSFRHFRRTQS